MTERASLRLHAAHALAEGRPLGPVLRALDQPRGAAAAEAGKLGESLRILGFEDDLCSLGAAWPAALLPALGRLARFPVAAAFHAPLLQTLAYFVLVAAAQLVCGYLGTRLLGPLYEDGGGVPPTLWLACTVGWIVPVGSFGTAAWLAAGAPGSTRLPGWGGQRSRAREAVLAAALREAGAPPAAVAAHQRECRFLHGEGATVAELDAIAHASLAAAEVSHRRFTSAVRVVGFAVLTGLALATTATVYSTIAHLPGRIG